MAVIRSTARAAVGTGRAVREGMRETWRQRFLAHVDDVTEQWRSRSAIVVAPHADDETLGCAATIMRKRDAGTRVRIVVVADGRHSRESAVITSDELVAIRRQEGTDAAAKLGVPSEDLHFLDLPNKVSGQHAQRMRDMLAEHVRDVDPDQVFVTSKDDKHADHRAANAAVRALAGRGGARFQAYEYPVWAWKSWPWQLRDHRARLSPTLLTDYVSGFWRYHPLGVRIGHEYLDRKREIVRLYKSQTTNLTGEALWAHLEPEFLARFLGEWEVFVPMTGERP